MVNKIFLGGTTCETPWRGELESVVQVPMFNPVVDDWTPKCLIAEQVEKDLNCNIHLYVITKEMTGVYSIAEVMDSVHTSGKIAILHIIPEGFDEGQLRSLQGVVNLVQKNGGIAYIDNDLMRTARILNNCFK